MKPSTTACENQADSISAATRREGVGASQCQAPAELGRADNPARLRAARAAFRDYHARRFWYMRPDMEVTMEDIPAIARGLRQNGGRRGFLLAEQLCR
jgi:hypothetical protein